MRLALAEAQHALEQDEVPVGAVIVARGQVIARAHNLCERLNDFTAHAEMQAFTAASEFLGGKHLDQCTLYVTLEPCPMCAGAAFWTRVGRIVFGASDAKRGYRMWMNPGQASLTHPKPPSTAASWRRNVASFSKTFLPRSGNSGEGGMITFGATPCHARPHERIPPAAQ